MLAIRSPLHACEPSISRALLLRSLNPERSYARGNRHPSNAPMVFKKMSSEELRLAQQWYDEDGKSPLEISELLRRDKSTITRHLVKRTPKKRDGRPRSLTASDVDALESLLVSMIKRANRQYEVTLEILRKEAKCRATVRTIQRDLHKRNSLPHRRGACLLSDLVLSRDRVGTG